MPTATDTIEALATQEYKYGLVTMGLRLSRI